MTIKEYRQLSRAAVAPFVESIEDKQNMEINVNQKSISEKETENEETEEKSREITIRFIKKVY